MSIRTLFTLLAFLTVPSVAQEKGTDSQTAPRTTVRSSALKFRDLWRVSVVNPDLAKAKLSAEEFQTAALSDKDLSNTLRKLLSDLTLQSDTLVLGKSFDEKPHAAIGALQYLVFVGIKSSTAKKAREQADILQGKVAKDIEYGYFQRNFDYYLSDINAYGGGVSFHTEVPVAPLFDEIQDSLLKMQLIFEQTGDIEWESKVLRWQLGAIGAVDLISLETGPIWTRLGQLENGTAGELNRFLAQASMGGTEIKTELAKDAPPAPKALTAKQCQEVIQLMLDMKMPWEAFLFLQHSKEKWKVSSPDALPLIQASWKEDINGGAAVWERALSRPWFIATVKVTPTTTLEDFLAELETRPNLPK